MHYATKMIKSVEESKLIGVDAIFEVNISYHDQLALKFTESGHVGDDIFPGLGVFEAFWGETES